ncbi:MAG TPA: monovalent cation/H(+) antiporter subunit G [Verrucomicrobiota bacterium]|nr:cation:proton antiporter [Verrucomicrobiales bacterium]HRI11864.1 monovalent cation/H(+) antiporter subunit G [Verrucomicrobiota bacterium]
MTQLLMSVCVLSGVGLMVIAAIGAARLPDVYCQAHAVAKGVTLGILLILLGLWIELGSAEAGFKIALAMVFQFATVPVSSHLVSRLAWEKRVLRWRARFSRGDEHPQK